MLNKKILMLTVVLISILTISAVNAADNITDNIVSADESGTSDDILQADESSSTNEIINIDENTPNEIVSVENTNDDKLGTETGSFGQLANKINNAEAGTIINLTQNYIYQDISSDRPYINGIPINKPLIIEGNGIIIDASNKAGFFNITSSNVIFNNITFKNAGMNGINWNGDNGVLNNTIFISNNGKLIKWEGNNNSILNSQFVGNLLNSTPAPGKFIKYSEKYIYGMISLKGNNNFIYNSNFNNNKALFEGYTELTEILFVGGTISIEGDNSIIESNKFNNNYFEIIFENTAYLISVEGCGGALFLKGNDCKVNNTEFTNNSLKTRASYSGPAYSKGAAMCVDGTVDISNSYFKSNCLKYGTYCYGGAVYIYSENGYDSIINSTFLDNCEGGENWHRTYGGAVYATSFDGDIINCTFINNNNNYDTGYYFEEAVDVSGEWNILKSTFINNPMGAIKSRTKGNINYNIFIGNTKQYSGRTINYITANNNVNVDYNWWGSNTNPQPFIEGTICNNWLCANLVIDDSNMENPIIYTKLNLLSNGDIISDEDYSKVPLREVTYSLFGKGSLSPRSSDTNNTIRYLNDKTGTYEVKITSIVDNQRTEITKSVSVVSVKEGSFTDLQKLIINSNDELNLTRDYLYDSSDVENMQKMFNINVTEGIVINKKIIINGNNFRIDGKNTANLFKILGTDIVLNNVNLVDAASYSVYIDSNGNVSLINNKEISNKNNPTILAKGGVSLQNNSFVNYIDITHGGTIYSNTTTIVLDGKTSYLSPQNIDLYATITDDNNNSIKISDFRFLEGSDSYLANYENNEYIYNNFILNNSKSYTFTAITTPNLINNKIISGKIIANVVDIKIILDKDSIKYNEIINATIILESSNITGTVSFLIDNIEQKVFDINGQPMIFEIKDLNIGEHNITAIYSGDSNYKSSNSSQKITVNKLDTQITADNYIFTYGDNLIIEANVGNDDATGNITLTVNKVEYTENITNKKAIFKIPTLNVGNYKFNVRYNGNQYYNAINTNNSISIQKLNIFDMNIAYSPVEITYGDQIILNVTFNENQTGKVSFDINGAKYVEDLINGKATFILNNLNAGHHIIVPTYTGDINYESKNRTIEFTVNKANSTINVIVKNNITYGENATLIITSNTDGKTKINVGNFEKIVDVINKGASVEIPNLDAKDELYNVEVLFYDENNNYKNTTGTTVLKVNKAQPSFNININDINYKETATLNVTFANDIKGYANITISNNEGFELKFANTDIGNELFSQELNNLNAFTYTITFEYGGNSNYNPITKYKTFNVFKLDPSINVEITNATYGQTARIIADIGVDGNVTILIGSVKSYDYNLINNNLIIQDINDVDVGNYTVKVIYKANTNYNTKTIDAKLTINKASSNVVASVNDICYSENATINVKSNVDGIAVVKISEEYIKTINILANTITPVVFENVPIGKYNVSIALKPTNKNYDESSYKTDFIISKKQTVIDLSVEDSIYGKDVIINVTASEDGKITLTVGDIVRERNVLANSMTTFNLGVLAANSYNVEVNFDAGENYKTSYKENTIAVSPAIAKITEIQTQNNVYGENTIIKVKTTLSGVLTVNMGSIVKTFDIVANDLTSLNLGVLDADSYNINIALNGGSNYTKPNNNTSIIVSKANTQIISSTVTAIYNEGKYIIATLKNNKGTPISGATVLINLNGIKTLITDTNGQVKLTTDGLIPKDYTATITFDGNKNYDKSTTTTKVIVKKATPKLTAKAKTFKKSVKTKKYSITLKTNQNKVMKNVKVTIKVNKKTYSAKTNSKGVATFKITKLNKKGTFKATITYSGDKYYNKVTKKVNIKCK